VDDFRGLRQLDDKLALAAPQSVCAADLVEAAGLHQVDVTQLTSGGLFRNSFCIFGILSLGRYSTQFRKIILASVPAELLQLRGERSLAAKSPEGVMAWKLGITPRFKLDFGHGWKSTKLPYERGKIVQ
jgi:hypothetical protein